MNVNNYLAYIYSDVKKEDRPEGVLYGVLFSALWVLFCWIGGHLSPVGIGIAVAMTILFATSFIWEVVFLSGKFTVKKYFLARAVLNTEMFLQNSLLLILAFHALGGFSLFLAVTVFLPLIVIPVVLGLIYSKRLACGIYCGNAANENQVWFISLIYAVSVILLNWKFLGFSLEAQQLTLCILTFAGLWLDGVFSANLLVFQKIYFLYKLEKEGYITPRPKEVIVKTPDEKELKGGLLFIEYLRFSKCPNCRKHGIPALEKIRLRGVHRMIVTCKYCGKKYEVLQAKARVAQVTIAIVYGIIIAIMNNHVVNIPKAVWILGLIILLYVYEYFAPLEEPENE